MLVNDIIRTTNNPLQQDSLLNAFSANDCAVLKSLWNVLDLDGLDEFINTITGWLLSRDPNRPTFTYIESTLYQGNNPNEPNRYFEFFNYATTSNAESFTFTSSADWFGGNIRLITNYDPVKSDGNPGGSAEITLGAYDWVAVKIMKEVPELGLQENQRLVVPMIWAKWLSHRIETNDASHKLEIIGEIVQFLAMDYFAAALLEAIAFEAINSSATVVTRIVGQDMRAVASTSTRTAEITLDMERGLDGVYTMKGVKFEPVYTPTAPVVGRINGAKFVSQEGQVVQRELTLVEVGETICVRDATAVATSNTFTAGDAIANKLIVHVRHGSNGKVAIIGRSMALQVNPVVAELETQGFTVEAFSEAYQSETVFTIDGSPYTWEQIKLDFTNPIDPITGQRKYASINAQGWIADSDIPNTLMYKANNQWAEKLVNEGYQVLDMGYPVGQQLGPSLFYNMEISTIFP